MDEGFPMVGSHTGLFPEKEEGRLWSQCWRVFWERRPMIFKRVNLISRASSYWKQPTDLLGVFSWSVEEAMWYLLWHSLRTILAKQLGKRIYPPENWMTISAHKWIVPVALKIEYKMNGFPCPPQSFVSEWLLLQEHVLILLSLREAGIWLRLWETRKGPEFFQ